MFGALAFAHIAVVLEERANAADESFVIRPARFR